MRSKNNSGNDETRLEVELSAGSAHSAHDFDLRHSDVVPKPVIDTSQVMHLSWPEERSLRVPDETQSAWMSAYETSFDHAFSSWERGDWLVPLVYASGENDDRLSGALLRFAHEVAVGLPDADEALAVLEVAQSAIDRDITKDLCLRIAENLIDEAYERFAHDRRFDRYFFCHCAAACARLAARVEHPDSARDAVEAIQSAVAALRIHDARAEAEVPKLAARLIREALGDSITQSRAASSVAKS